MSTYFELLEAVRNEDFSYLQDVIRERKQDINFDQDEDGIKCIHIAAGLENVCILHLLLENGATVDSQTSEGLTALHIAAMWGRTEQVAALLKYGADCLLVDATGCNALRHAANSEEDGSQACVDLILSNNVREQDNVQTTPEIDFKNLDDSPWVTPRRGSRRKNASRDHVSDRQESCEHNGDDLQTISESDIDAKLNGSPWITPCHRSRRKNASRDPVSGRQESDEHNGDGLQTISESDIDAKLNGSPWVTPRRGSRRKNTSRDPVSDRVESDEHNGDGLQTISESDIDAKLNSSPWITPRRGSKNSRRFQTNSELMKAVKRLSAAFENFRDEDSPVEDIESSRNSKENIEELLTELSSGLLSSSGHDSSTGSNSPTFSYSTITGLDSQRLASLSNVDCSEYRTLYGSGILTECSTLDDFDAEEEKNKDEMKVDECEVHEGERRGKRLQVEDIDGVSDEESCVYETADEEIAEDLKKGNHIINSENDNERGVEYRNLNEGMKGNNHGMEERGVAVKFGEREDKEKMKEDTKDTKRNKELENVKKFGKAGVVDVQVTGIENMKENKETGNIDKVNSDVEISRHSGNVNRQEDKATYEKAKEGSKNDEESKPRKKRHEEEKRHDDIIEEKEQNRNCFNINNHFNNLSIINHEGNNEKVTTEEHKNAKYSFHPILNQSALPLNSTFLVDSPLQHQCKKPSNFFIPMENDKPSTSKTKPSPPNSRKNNYEETIIYDWRELSMDQRNETIAIIPAGYKKISCNELRKRIKDHGHTPGPITAQTKMLYVKKLWKMDQGIGKRHAKDSSPCRLYPVEIRLILTGKTEIPDCSVLEQDMMKEFCKSPRKVQWRGGTEKSSFNYLLLDPRVTLDLPQRSKKLSLTEAFRSFVLSIFYVGKGKRARPYAHLHEAIKYSKSKSNAKLDQIWEIWTDGLGVISLHLFQNAIPVESFTREACMLEALGLSQLTNQKRGEYYGICANLELARKRKLGIFFLYKAYKIFLQEGERQICREDL